VLTFGIVALVAGNVLLSLPLLLDAPQEPFVLLTLLVGLVAPAAGIVLRESGRAGVRSLLRDAVRPSVPWQWLPIAALAIPTLTWLVALPLGGAEPLSAALLTLFAADLLAGLIIVNLLEETAWTGFFQRRAIAHWGHTRGSLVTALLFAGVHLPLAFTDAESARDVLLGCAVLLGTGIGLRLLIASLDVWSGRSLLTIGTLHASFNATFGLIESAHDWIRLSITVLLGLACLVITTRSRMPGEAARSTARA
jgi:membrane protease YdiL (CAAX protease family)